MEDVLPLNESICDQMLSRGLDADGVRAFLHEKGILGDQLVAAYQQAVKRMRNTRRRNRGFAFMVIGAFLGFLSCVLTITHVLPHLFDFVFYGLTTVAVCLVVLGLYFVFE